MPKKVTGIGGIFFKSQDPETLKQWYQQQLGLSTDQYGCMFEWRHADDPEKIGLTQWSAFPAATNYFGSEKQQFMINYRVEDLEWLVERLRTAGVVIVDEIAVYDYGKFVHILDPEGTQIELWEPIDPPLQDSSES